MPAHASQASENPRDQIDGTEGPATVKGFAQRSQIPQAPHVEGDMHEAAMQKHVGDESPPLARQGVGAVVGAEHIHHFVREVERWAACDHHRDKDHHVGAEEHLRQRNAGFAFDPGRSHDRLDRVFVLFAALRRLMPHTPLTDLLAKRQWRQLPPASNAVRHVLQKSISSGRDFGRAGEVRIKRRGFVKKRLSGPQGLKPASGSLRTRR